MKSKIYLFGILLVLIILYVVGCRRAGLWLVKKDEPVHADAIVLLIGSIADRVLQAVDLYQNGLADEVIIAGEESGAFRELKGMGVNIISGREQIRNALIFLGIPADSIIILTGNAQSTQQEAMIIREYIKNEPKINTLLLVSSAPHMRRAYMIFKNTFKKSREDIRIFCSPSSYTDFNAKKWWKSKNDIETVLIEYLKIANFFLIDRRKL